MSNKLYIGVILLFCLFSKSLSDTCGGTNCGTSSCCLDQSNGAQCYSANQYTCVQSSAGTYKLCPVGESACGVAPHQYCYDTTQYYCVNGGLIQHGASTTTQPYVTTTAPPTTVPTTTTVPPTTTTQSTASHSCGGVNCGSELCCLSASNTGMCYSSSNYVCENGMLCPVGLAACGQACYNPAQYHCVNGQLQQGSSTTTAAPNNCGGAANTAGVNCAEASQCCGEGTITPSCVTDPSAKQCCTWYLASTQCNVTQACCGSLGAGASSYAFCCAAGTTCCSAAQFGENTCCSPSDVCCGIYGGESWCCPQGATCGASAYQCGAAATTTAAPTTAAPNNCAAAGNAPGIQCAEASECCGEGTITPSCLTDPTAKHCCQWYLASTQCNVTQACCGGLGSGASSYAFCCAEGTSCCSASELGINTCCSPTDVCCGLNGQESWCCPQGSTCGASASSCGAVTTTTAPPNGNCPAAANAPGVQCAEASECCGSGSMSPSCLTDPNMQCCNWYLASTQCNVTQSCCGSLGSGASSSAFCCAESTTCCSASQFGINTCCASSDVCCGLNGQESWCCPQGSTCGASASQCS